MIRIVTDTTSGLSPDLAKQYDIPILDTRTIGAPLGRMMMKPILALRDGRVEPIERQRTQRRALQRLKEIVMTESAQGAETQLSIMHADCQKTAKALASVLQQSLNTPDVVLMDLVPAIVTHAGPGALAVGFIAAEES